MVILSWGDGELKVHWKILSMNPYSELFSEYDAGVELHTMYNLEVKLLILNAIKNI